MKNQNNGLSSGLHATPSSVTPAYEPGSGYSRKNARCPIGVGHDIIILVNIFTILLLSLPAFATPADTFNEANKLYLNGEYEKAMEKYNRIDVVNPDLEYNLASAYFKLGHIGKAMLHLNRSLKIRPGDADALANLKHIKSVKIDRENVSDRGIIKEIAKAIINFFSINTLTILTLFTYILAIASALGLMLTMDKAKFAISLATFSVMALIIGSVCYYRIVEHDRIDRAIAIDKSIPAYVGPSEATDKVFTFHEGTEVSIGRRDGTYVFVTLSSGLSGWTKLESLERI